MNIDLNDSQAKIRMNIRLYPLVLCMALTAGRAILVTGCNRLEVVPPNTSAPPPTTVGTEIDDTVMTTKVKSALLGDHYVKRFDIKVETRKGMVLFSGFVDNRARPHDRRHARCRRRAGRRQ